MKPFDTTMSTIWIVAAFVGAVVSIICFFKYRHKKKLLPPVEATPPAPRSIKEIYDAVWVILKENGINSAPVFAGAQIKHYQHIKSEQPETEYGASVLLGHSVIAQHSAQSFNGLIASMRLAIDKHVCNREPAAFTDLEIPAN